MEKRLSGTRSVVFLAILGAAALAVAVVLIHLLGVKTALEDAASWAPWKQSAAIACVAVGVIVATAVGMAREVRKAERETVERSANRWLRRVQATGYGIRDAIIKKGHWTDAEAQGQLEGWRRMTIQVIEAYFDASVAATFDSPVMPRAAPQNPTSRLLLIHLMEDRIANLNDIILRLREGRLSVHDGGENMDDILTGAHLHRFSAGVASAPTPPGPPVAAPPTASLAIAAPSALATAAPLIRKVAAAKAEDGLPDDAPINVTVETLLGLYAGRTAAAAGRLAAPYISRTMRVNGVVDDVRPSTLHGDREMSVVVKVQPNDSLVAAYFDDPRMLERVTILDPGSDVSIVGKIARIAQNVLSLEHCKLCD